MVPFKPLWLLLAAASQGGRTHLATALKPLATLHISTATQDVAAAKKHWEAKQLKFRTLYEERQRQKKKKVTGATIVEDAAREAAKVTTNKSKKDPNCPAHQLP
jgi:hypothetical protein